MDEINLKENLSLNRTYLFFLITNNPANTAINPKPKVNTENSGISILLISFVSFASSVTKFADEHVTLYSCNPDVANDLV